LPSHPTMPTMSCAMLQHKYETIRAELSTVCFRILSSLSSMFFLSCPLAVPKHTTGSSTKIARVGPALELFAWLGTPQAVRKPPRATYSVHGCHLDSHENRTYRLKSQRCRLPLPSSSK
jgi:hypothetical protein